VIVTELKPGKEAEYREWAKRTDEMEGTFPGFRGSYVQAPEPGDNVWTTLLRFDTVDKLNAWLNSPQRAALLKNPRGSPIACSFTGSTRHFPAGCRTIRLPENRHRIGRRRRS